MKSIVRNIFLAAGVGGLALSLVGCGSEEKTAVEYEKTSHKVDTYRVELGEVPMTMSLPGSVVPDQQARIASRLMGYIRALPVEAGQKVKRGDLLFSIDPQDIQSQISQAQAGFQQAKAALENAKADFERFTELYKDESVSRQQYDGVRLQYNVAQENLVAARAGLEQAKAQINYAEVKAPFDGVVVQKMATAGDLASPGQPVVVLENLTAMSVQTEVSQDLYAVINVGDKALIKIDGIDQAVEGEIYSLVSSANPKTRGHTTKLSLPAVQAVNSGTFARVSFIRGQRQTILVPAEALVNRSGVEGVFVVGANNEANFRMVRTGMTINSKIEIQAGLDVDEQIVVSNNQTLVNGDKLEISN